MGETAKFVTETPFLRGLSNLIGALENPERFGERFIQDAVTSTVVPRGVAAISRSLDPVFVKHFFFGDYLIIYQ